MRFNSLPDGHQKAIALIWTEHTLSEAAEGLFPYAYPDTWLAGFRRFNVKIKGNGLPSPDAMERVVDWIELQVNVGLESAYHLGVHEKCTCGMCGIKY